MEMGIRVIRGMTRIVLAEADGAGDQPLSWTLQMPRPQVAA